LRRCRKLRHGRAGCDGRAARRQSTWLKATGDRARSLRRAGRYGSQIRRRAWRACVCWWGSPAALSVTTMDRAGRAPESYSKNQAAPDLASIDSLTRRRSGHRWIGAARTAGALSGRASKTSRPLPPSCREKTVDGKQHLRKAGCSFAGRGDGLRLQAQAHLIQVTTPWGKTPTRSRNSNWVILPMRQRPPLRNVVTELNHY
jgi:hypothetical protein